MHSHRLLGSLALAVILAAAAAVFIFPQLQDYLPIRFTLEGNTPNILASAVRLDPSQTPLGKVDPQTLMEVELGLHLRDEHKLDAFLKEQAAADLGDEPKVLTPQECIQRFSPTVQDHDLVIKYLRSYRLQVSSSTDRRLVKAFGTKQQMEDAFGVTIARYQTLASLVPCAANVEFLSNTGDPRLPPYLSKIVRSVDWPSAVSSYQPHSTAFEPCDEPDPDPLAKPKKKLRLPLTPAKVATAYNFPSPVSTTSFGKGYTGKRVTIAICTAYGYRLSDAEGFWKQTRITRTGKIVDIGVGGPMKASGSGGETTLDLQQAGAHAPDADIHMFVGVDPRFTTFNEVYNQAINSNPHIISISWGLCENYMSRANIATEHALFKLAAAQGIAIFVASGDNGAYDCTQHNPKLGTAVDYPSSDEYVTAVGGTSIQLDSDLLRSDERGWRGAGGGVSMLWSQPAWQKVPGVPQNGRRVTPDVAGVSDPWTGYATFFQGKWHVAGGTSYAAPVWAGYWAQVIEACRGRRIGNVNRVLYYVASARDKHGNLKYPNVFFDIVKGNNNNNGRTGYPCTPGWDHVTGWGVPNGTALLLAVQDAVKKR